MKDDYEGFQLIDPEKTDDDIREELASTAGLNLDEEQQIV